MKYLFFKSPKGNFGDDLNPWLWPRIFGMENAQNDDTYFLGIGSILHRENASLSSISNSKKIIFGTGVRPSKFYNNLRVDENWDIKFLRGPLSSASLGNRFEYITDAAYALRQLPEFDSYINTTKKYEVSLMPYFHSVDFFDWEKICKILGYHYISPFSENGVEVTIKEIAASKILITEAMHGAIVADILRVPWHRYILSTPSTEGGRVSDFKWTDWLNSIDVYSPEVTYIPFYKTNRISKLISKLTNRIIHTEFLNKATLQNDIIEKLNTLPPTYLSNDQLIHEIDQKISAKIEEVKSQQKMPLEPIRGIS